MVVAKVLMVLTKSYMVVTDYLVGIDCHVKEVMKLLDVDSMDVSLIVGIHGIGGIGKTTIAKVIYNQLLEHFECCSFLEDIRETSQREGLVNLQNELISDLQKEKFLGITDVDEGINTIENTVCGKKVLIVLDDVDKKSQFDKLVARGWFDLGSRIIVTTNDKEVLNLLEVDRTYEPPLMEFDHSIQLFSKHAFRKDFPPKDYDILSRDIVSTIKGLPSALEILGSFLFGKEKEIWEETLMRLEELNNEPIHLKLAYLKDL